MKKNYKIRSNFGIVVWIIIILFLIIFQINPQDNPRLFSLLNLSGSIIMIYSCYCLAKAKGQNGLWGLLGILTIIGYIALLFFPDKTLDTPAK